MENCCRLVFYIDTEIFDRRISVDCRKVARVRQRGQN